MHHECETSRFELEAISHESPITSSVVNYKHVAISFNINRLPIIHWKNFQIELYRGLLIASAHLHLMTRDALDSSRHCYRDGMSQLRAAHQWVQYGITCEKLWLILFNIDIVSRLAGKLEAMMCLILQMEGKKGGRLGDFYPVVENLLTTTVLPRFFDCSAKYADVKIRFL